MRLLSKFLAAVVVGFALTLPAQTPQPPMPLAFEVASVRVSPPGNEDRSVVEPYGTRRFHVANVPLRFLLLLAYDIDEHQLAGQPKWADTTLYEVSATSEDGVLLTYEAIKPRLQTLLQERFHLQLHHELRQFKGYALLPAKGGPTLKASQRDTGSAYMTRSSLRASSATPAMLASMLARITGRPVVDKTGLTGAFDVKLDFAPPGAVDSTLPSIFTALQEQLGLKLENATVPVDMFVIDRVDEVPTEN